MKTRITAVVAAATVVLAVAACAPSEKPDETTSDKPLTDYQGQTLDAAWADMSTQKVQTRIIDMSVQFDGTATFDDSVSISEYPDWTVLTLCADADSLPQAGVVELGVIPDSLATTAVIDDAKSGKFDGDITCEGLSDGPAA